MKKRIWKKSSLFLISSIVIVGIAIVLACADDEESDYPTSFFAPETIHTPGYSKYFRTYHVFYDTNLYKEDNIKDFNEINVTEWSQYFKDKVTEGNIEYLLYTARLGEIDTLIFSLKKPGYPINNFLKNFSILKTGDTRSVLDFLYYVGFAKRCEKYSTYNNPWWYDEKRDTNDPKYDVAGMNALISGGLKQITNTTNDFVKQRYVFQILRLYDKLDEYDQCIQFYTQQMPLIESGTNSIKYRSKGYLARAYYKKKDYGTANYLYSVIYGECDSMRITAYLSFHPMEEKDWQKTLSMTKNQKEKITLLELLGIYNDPYDAMKMIYDLDPKSGILDLLLVRAVNTEEEGFLYQTGEYGEDIDSVGSVGKVESTSINKDLVDFLKTVADKKNTTKPYEWDLSAGYLCWAIGDNSFDKYLKNAETECHGDSLVLDQIRLIKLLALIKSGKAEDRNFEGKVLDELHWLRVDKHAEDFRESDADKFIVACLEEKYAAVGDKMVAMCLSHQLPPKVLYDGQLLDNIVAFINKPNHTPFEEYALSEFNYKAADLLNIKALKPFYKHQFKEALAILNQDDHAGSGETYGDPFVIHINDCHDCDNEDKNKATYSETSFIERMIRLEDSVTSDPTHVARTYFLLANGFYNMSYYGNSRGLYETRLTGVDDDLFSDGGKADSSRSGGGDLMECTTAEEYYKKAMTASIDPEFKAKCCFMAAKCAQNTYYTVDGGAAGYFGGGGYYDQLKSTYSSTKYYQEIIQECGYFKTYLGKKTQ